MAFFQGKKVLARDLHRHATAFPGQVANLITAGRVVLLFLATAFAVSGDATLPGLRCAFVALEMDWLRWVSRTAVGWRRRI